VKRSAANRVDVSTLHRFLRFSKDETSRLVRGVLSGEGATGWTIGVVFVGDDRMKRLHAEYLGKRRTTDVLSFVYEDGATPDGEVVVCLDQARRQAPDFGCSYAQEVSRLVIHGVLHLLGYDDTRPKARTIMKAQEEQYVRRAHARTRR